MLDMLRRIVQEVISAPDLRTALETMVRRVRDAMGAEVCSLYLLDPRQERYLLIATEGLKPEAVGQVSLGLNEGLVGQVGMREEPLNLEDAFTHPKFHYLAETGEDPFHAFLGVPVMHQGTVLGVLVVQQRDARRFEPSEEAFLVTLSAQLSAVLATARANGGLKALREQVGGTTPQPTFYDGLVGSQGAAIGRGVLLYPVAEIGAVPDRPAADIDAEIALLDNALHKARLDIRALAERAGKSLGEQEQALFEVYLRMLDQHALAAEVISKIRDGNWAQGALRMVIDEHTRAFEQMEDAYLQERAADVRDLGRRVLAHLQSGERRQADFHSDTVLLGDEITTAMLMEVPLDQVVGIVSGQGSRNSHMAIVARSLGIPTVVGVQGVALKKLDGHEIIVDGFRGRIIADPNSELRHQFERLIREEKHFLQGLEKLRDLPAQTIDGKRIKVFVNTGLMTDINLSLQRGAEGVGLYRTEIPFMIQERFPSEEEQQQIYRQQLASFHPRPVTMRTLDVGGDKSLPYFPIQEENPFLGWRGIRLTLDHPEIFMLQVRAMLAASEGLNNLRIMLPMVTKVSEVEEAQHLIHRAWMEVREEGIEVDLPPVGVMVEVPAAVYQARAFAERVDFLSIGTNDLTQYLLAVDRNNHRVANLYDSWHPAVLHAIVQVVEAAHAEGKTVSVCGEMAGDPAAAVILLAMGVDMLSMNASHLPKVKSAIRQLRLADLRPLLHQLLAMDSGEVVAASVNLWLEQAGLGDLVKRRQLQ